MSPCDLWPLSAQIFFTRRGREPGPVTLAVSWDGWGGSGGGGGAGAGAGGEAKHNDLAPLIENRRDQHEGDEALFSLRLPYFCLGTLL